jgi:hypothetical protein
LWGWEAPRGGRSLAGSQGWLVKGLLKGECLRVGRKLSSSHLTSFLHPAINKLVLAGHQWLTPVILATWEVVIQRITVLGQPREILHQTPISKISRAKWAGGVAQVVECLLCKCQALISNFSPKKKKKNAGSH